MVTAGRAGRASTDLLSTRARKPATAQNLDSEHFRPAPGTFRVGGGRLMPRRTDCQGEAPCQACDGASSYRSSAWRRPLRLLGPSRRGRSRGANCRRSDSWARARTRRGLLSGVSHCLTDTPRVTTPPWNSETWGATHVSLDTTAALPDSTVMPPAETVARVGPLTVRNRCKR